VTVAGELDRAQARQLLDAVALLADAGHRSITVSTEQVTFCDVAGLRALLAGHALAARRGCELRLAETSPCLRRLLTIVGMHTELGRFTGPIGARRGAARPPALAVSS
jgi:anti-anti-sigma factor